MTEPPTNTPSPLSPPNTYPAPLPRVRDLFAVYMTGITAVLVVLNSAADLDVLLLHSPVAGLVGLLSVVAPLEAVLLAAFTSLVNVYVVRRMPRDSHGGHVEYDGSGGYGYDLTFTSRASHTGGIRGALQTLL